MAEPQPAPQRPSTGPIPRADWWPLLAWAGDLSLSADGKHPERFEQSIRQATLARFDAVVIPALREGVPLYESATCGTRGRIRRYPWCGMFVSREPPFDVALRQASSAGLRVWAQMDIVVGGTFDGSRISLARSRPRWTIRNAQGRPSPIGIDTDRLLLCPCNPDVERLFCEAAVEVVGGFSISALVLDARAVPADVPDGPTANCLCFSCQERAEAELGFDLQEALDEGTPETWREWREWRVAGWLELARRIRTQVWSVRPGLPVFVRSLAEPPVVGDEQSVPARFSGPTWLEWARSGLAEMVLLESGPGSQTDVERELLSALRGEDLDCLALPLFREPPSFSESSNRARAIGASLPGWGLIQRVAEVWSSTILLKPVPRHGEASTFPAPEIDPLSACIHALLAAEALAGGMPLGADVTSVRDALVKDGRGLELEKLEGLIFQLGTVATMLDQGTDRLDDQAIALRGWVELARRLLRWHANVNSRELYLFDAG